MKCHECVAQGLKSTVTIGVMTTTGMFSPSWYDEDGRFHRHDPNPLCTSYHCSNGHSWMKSVIPPCPSCDYGKTAI